MLSATDRSLPASAFAARDLDRLTARLRPGGGISAVGIRRWFAGGLRPLPQDPGRNRRTRRITHRLDFRRGQSPVAGHLTSGQAADNWELTQGVPEHQGASWQTPLLFPPPSGAPTRP